MGILLISFIVLIAGIILLLGGRGDGLPGYIFARIGGVLAVAFTGIILICVPIEGRNNLIEYEQDKAVIEVAMSNDKLTGEERTFALELAKNNNTFIQQTKHWRKNFWIGWFYYKPISDLELFDMDKIHKALTVVRMDF